jgi:chromate transporter
MEAFRFWLKLGFISFGGPAGQIAIMHRELVEVRRWISEKRFLHALNYCMVLPGPEAQQLATYLGWLMHGTVGGVIAGMLFVLPSLVILIALSWLYMSAGDVPLVQGIFYGIKPAVTAIVLQAAWRIGGRTLRNGALVAIAIAAFIAIFVFDVPFPAIVIGAAVLGVIGGKLRPQLFTTGNAHVSNASVSETPAIIDDDTPTPPHAVFRRARMLMFAGIGLLMWLVAMAILLMYSGTESALTQMGWFFTKAALMTFGGAYAVLPYVYQGAVETFQWVTPQQMIDGLALGETTPGPLIMVVAFVGYLGGVANNVVSGNPFLSGAIAACVVTFFTFLPSFIFILVGAPFIESTRNNLRLAAPLNAITAAVVGVIVNLALFFLWHVWWPKSSTGAVFGGGFDWVAALITLGAAIALLRFKANVIWVILVCGACGGMGAALTLLR